jgi:hypothetical protein
VILLKAGMRQEALTCAGEAAARWQHLAQREPGRHDDHYRSARAKLARFCAENGFEPGDAVSAELQQSQELARDATPYQP